MSGAGALVLLVEDDASMRRFLRVSLGSAGYRLVEAASSQEALSLASSQNPELVLLDLGLPDGDGVEVARRLREWSAVPIIVLSARGGEADKVAALDIGADDYLAKPFGTQELHARMRVALRRAGERGSATSPVIEVEKMRVDLGKREVTVEGKEVHLTPIEFRMLSFLARNLGRLVTHAQILREVWGPGHEHEAHYVRVHMASLRRKVERDPARPRLLVTETGVGYRLREPA